jgi:multicomponent Na+:H+ antiporter subunit F
MSIVIGTEISGVVGVATAIAGFFVVLAMLGAIYRLLKGPSLGDRVIALDLLTGLMVVFLVLFSIASTEHAYIYAAIALALIGFLATVAFARFMERSGERGDD